MNRSLLIACFVVMTACGCIAPPQARVFVRGHSFKAELAEDAPARMRGLMNRASLAPDEAMLFVFPEEAVYGFWMKNMRFALDIIWISSQGRIVEIKENFQPCVQSSCESYLPQRAASYVLEINAGLARAYQLSVGDFVEIRRRPAL